MPEHYPTAPGSSVSLLTSLAIVPVLVLFCGVLSPAYGDSFAPGMFQQIEDAGKLSAPSFEQMQSGMVLGEQAAPEESLDGAPPAREPASLLDGRPGVRPQPAASGFRLQ